MSYLIYNFFLGGGIQGSMQNCLFLVGIKQELRIFYDVRGGGREEGKLEHKMMIP